MALRLHYSPASPFARKVRIVIEELGRGAEVELLSATTAPTGTGATPVPGNPLGKVPTLERGDGPALFDSRVICRYLAEGSSLYPKGEALWEVLTLEAIGDGLMDAAIAIAYETRFRSEEMRSADWVNGQWNKINRALDVLENRWMAHLYGPLDMGQIAVGSALGYLEFRQPQFAWREGRASLAAWYQKLSERPSFAATAPA